MPGLLVALLLASVDTTAPTCSPDPRLAPCLRGAPECAARLAHQGRWVEYYRTFPLDMPQPHVKRAVVVVHGGQRTADRYFGAVVEAARASCALNDTLIVAPRFVIASDRPAEAQLFFDDNDDWKKGALSSQTAVQRLSSFEIMDEIVRHLTDRKHLPNLATIVVAGHSSGGQFTQRYAVSNALTARCLGPPRVRRCQPILVPVLNAERVSRRARPRPGAARRLRLQRLQARPERRNEYLSRLDEATLVAQTVSAR
jgi:pimeloyl-ACP methyl ester carboxylesterase